MSEEDFERCYRELIRKSANNTQAVTSTRSQVVVYWLQGWTYVTIAKSLQISRSTVSKYLQDACTQFEVSKLQDLRVLFDRYEYIWNAEDREQVGTAFDNLPISHCQQPIGREKDIDRLLKLIDNRNIVWLKAIGGCGKTTTILAVANRCKNEHKFDAIVYISAQTEAIINNRRIPVPAQRTRLDIYRQIFNTFDRSELMYASISSMGEQSNYDHLHDCLCQLLQQYRTFLIFDNFDTDENYSALKQVIHRLPTSTRILVGSRQVFDEQNYRVEQLQFLDLLDAKILIWQRLRDRRCKLTDEQIDEIAKYTRGLPLAIEFIIGLVSIPGRDLSDLNRFLSGNPYPQDLLNYCLEKAIAQLKSKSLDRGYKILQSIALFPDSAPREALISIGDFQSVATFDRGIKELLNLSLIMVFDLDRYQLHPVVRAYLNNISQPATSNHLRHLLMRWYYDRFVTPFDESNWQEWQDYRSLEIEWINLAEVVDWCFYSFPHLYQECIDFWNCLKGFTLFCGRWEERKQWLEWLISAAETNRDKPTQALALYHQSFTITCMNETSSKARDLALAAWELDVDFNDRFNLAAHIATLHIYQKKHESFVLAKRWLEDAYNLSTNLSAVNLGHLKYCQAQAEFGLNHLDLAETLYREAFSLAQSIQHRRLAVYNQGGIIKILIAKGKLDEAEILLLDSLSCLIENKDARATAVCYGYLAILSKKKEDYDGWVKWHQLAIGSFQKLNMQHKASELIKMQFIGE